MTSVQFGPASEKDLHSVVPTGIHISDKMDATIISKCLELTRLLKDQNTSFDIRIKLESSHLRMTSEVKKSIKTKSTSQQKRDELRMKKFVETKSLEKAPTTDVKSGDSKPKEDDNKDMVKGMKKALKVAETEKEVACFLDNLLKPKVPVPKISTREVKEKKNLKCETFIFRGQTQQDLKSHIDQEHGEKTSKEHIRNNMAMVAGLIGATALMPLVSASSVPPGAGRASLGSNIQ